MGNNHDHTQHLNFNKAFAIGIGLNITFVAVEVYYGLIANSSALLADAGHNVGDVLGLIFAWFAIWLAGKKPKGKYSYGFKKSTILISVLNALLLFGAVIAIAWDAIGKFQYPQEVAGKQVMIVAGIGVIINTITALMFLKGQKDDLNIKGAFLHMAADAGVSLGVVIGGLLIAQTGLFWIDPIMSLLIILVIFWGTGRLFIESINLALDAVPKHINIEEVRSFLLSKEGVEHIHDFHIWGISTSQAGLTAHLIMPINPGDDFISDLQKDLKREFKISHTTFQIENKISEENCIMDC